MSRKCKILTCDIFDFELKFTENVDYDYILMRDVDLEPYSILDYFGQNYMELQKMKKKKRKE